MRISRQFIRQVEDEETVETSCDLCLKKSPWPGGNWSEARSSYRSERIVVKYEDEESYPEGGHADTVSIDVCPECFIDKILPLVHPDREAAKTPKEESW